MSKSSRANIHSRVDLRPGTPAARAVAAALGALAAVVLAGCGQLEPAAPAQPITDPAQQYVRLGLNHAAINLTTDTTAPAANKVQLVATPYDGTGAPIVGAPTPTFTALDTAAVTVTPEGLLQGRGAATQVKVVATLVIGGVRHADTAVVNVRDIAAADLPVLDTFSIQVSPEKAVWYKGGGVLTRQIAIAAGIDPGTATLSPRAMDAGGNPIAGLAIEYVSLDLAVAFVDRRTGEATPIASGYVRVVAQTFAYGVSKIDTATYAVNPSFTADVGIDSLGFYFDKAFRPAVPSWTIVAGGIVGWLSDGTPAVTDVTFDDPTSVTAPPAIFCDFLNNNLPPGPYCDAGNIPVFTGGNFAWRFRQFLVPGTYPFHSTTTGLKGQIVVVEQTEPPLP